MNIYKFFTDRRAKKRQAKWQKNRKGTMKRFNLGVKTRKMSRSKKSRRLLTRGDIYLKK